MNKKYGLLSGFAILLLFFSMTSTSLLVNAEAPESKVKPLVISAHGKVPGKDLYVYVIAEVPEGHMPKDIAAKVLAKQGARQIDSQNYKFTGLVWDQFADSNPDNDAAVTQNYNPTDEPSGVDGRTVLANTHTTWNSVDTSSFAFSLYPANIDRCPSLVLECHPDPDISVQNFDGNNDVGWVELTDPLTLGVAWYGTFTDEVDIALDIGHSWYTDGTVFFDVETVLLHENGHALGLAHSIDASVMDGSYDSLLRTLHDDDIAGISELYPVLEETTPVEPSITITSPTTSTVSGRITISASVEGVTEPTVTFTVTDPDGNVILGEPDHSAPYQTRTHTKNWGSGNYVISASIDSIGKSDSITVQKEGASDDGGPSGGSQGPCKNNPLHPKCQN